ncbi:FAD binding domain-containing protein [Paenibacillus prosopidis]|uniref:Carbon-monoxide dehydrogenase medium subunit n=1 Tax=Paenibacillus prosopidis TaxID=630520 RepID=A0A368W4I3_9BACL|nr:FAD binding domain-containing protein [Paenibacillus prosopidis]RCW50341.1 carbon-monoxide dehydrogenase medium subunit [Paenibacillus prosopidis]
MSMNVQETLTSPLVWHPQTAAEAWQYKQTYGIHSVFVAGGTLLRTHWESGAAPMPQHFIDLSAIRGLNEIRVGEEGLLIGGQSKLQECRTNPLLQRHFPMAVDAIRSIAAPSIRNLATIGGNIASIVGDSVPALLVYDASLIWYNGQTEQEEKLSDWLLAAGQSGYRNDRLLLSLKLPLKSETSRGDRDENSTNSKMKRFGAFHKVGRREAFTPSVVTAAVSGSITDTGLLNKIQIAVGGGQTIPRRLIEVEKEIVGTAVDGEMLRHLFDRALELYEPREDVFASASYRKQTAANLIVTELWKASGRFIGQGG